MHASRIKDAIEKSSEASLGRLNFFDSNSLF